MCPCDTQQKSLESQGLLLVLEKLSLENLISCAAPFAGFNSVTVFCIRIDLAVPFFFARVNRGKTGVVAPVGSGPPPFLSHHQGAYVQEFQSLCLHILQRLREWLDYGGFFQKVLQVSLVSFCQCKEILAFLCFALFYAKFRALSEKHHSKSLLQCVPFHLRKGLPAGCCRLHWCLREWLVFQKYLSFILPDYEVFIRGIRSKINIHRLAVLQAIANIRNVALINLFIVDPWSF